MQETAPYLTVTDKYERLKYDPAPLSPTLEQQQIEGPTVTDEIEKVPLHPSPISALLTAHNAITTPTKTPAAAMEEPKLEPPTQIPLDVYTKPYSGSPLTPPPFIPEPSIKLPAKPIRSYKIPIGANFQVPQPEETRVLPQIPTTKTNKINLDTNLKLRSVPTGRSVQINLLDKSVSIVDQQGRITKRYKALVGEPGNWTPRGKFTVLEKVVPGSKERFLGSAWLGFHRKGNAYYGIHGMTAEHDPNDTLGCVALNDEDAKELYGLIGLGDQVTITDQPDAPKVPLRIPKIDQGNSLWSYINMLVPGR